MKYFALPITLSTLLLLSACSSDSTSTEDTDVNTNENQPTTPDDDLNDGVSDNQQDIADNGNGGLTTTSYRLVRIDTSTDDGVRSNLYEYDAAGNPVVWLTQRTDGTVRRAETTFSDSGFIMSRNVDSDSDGTVDITIQYNTNDTGNVTSYLIFDTEIDGAVGAAEFSYNDNNVPTTQRVYDVNSDGSWSQYGVVNFNYSNGLLSQASYDAGPDGVADSTTDYFYDNVGRLTSTQSLSYGEMVDGIVEYEEGDCNSNYINARFAYFCVTVTQ